MNPLIVKALQFAEHKHRFQSRKDAGKTPYIKHLVDVFAILALEADIQDHTILCAALLHDTIEDTDTTTEELRVIFGDQITQIVADMTDDKSLPKQTRKELQIAHASHICYEAKLVKLADKIANIRELQISPPPHWEEERITNYFLWAGRVVDQIRGTHPLLESLFDKALPESLSESMAPSDTQV